MPWEITAVSFFRMAGAIGQTGLVAINLGIAIDAVVNEYQSSYNGRVFTLSFVNLGASVLGVAIGIHSGKKSIREFKSMWNRMRSKGGSKSINSNEIRLSQSLVNCASEIIDSMKINGWTGEAIDVVRMSDGKLTTIDNTRVLAAQYAGIDVQANLHAYNELLPDNLIERFTTSKGSPKTWGEAVSLRIGKQNNKYRSLYPQGLNITGWRGN